MSIEFILITILSIFILYVVFTYNQNKNIKKFNHNIIEEDNINTTIEYKETQSPQETIIQTETITPVEIFKNSCDHSSNEQYARMCRAVSDDLMGEIISIDSEEMSMKIYSHGNPKDIYTVTLLKCECMDFKNRHLPCKHIYRLELGVINLL